ncbi:MAG: M28 family peptidase, partial [Coriobacteriia bacterium]|nr:M28 family peptidase [Coriobacteriia bacterium]
RETTPEDTQMSGEMSHVIELVETIGPRPASSDAEASAADYIQGVFEARGLDVERQEFDTPRTYAWAYVIYHLFTIGAAVLSRWLPWQALALALVSAVLMRMDLDTRWGLTSLMPKGPSQNVIARYIPRVRRNERTHRVIVVAHYDSARSSLAFSPGMVRNFSATFGLMKGLTYTVPVLVAISLLPWLKAYRATWSWYVILAASAYLLVPLLINVHRELFMKHTDGANDNASGVATMLGVMERIVPEADNSGGATMAFSRVHSADEQTGVTEAALEDAWLSYAPAGAPREPELWSGGDDEIDWTEPASAGRGQTTMDMPSAPRVTTVMPEGEPGRARTPRADRSTGLTGDLFGSDDLFAEPAGASAAPETPAQPTAASERHGLFGRAKREAAPETAPAGKPERHGVRDWLGVGRDFDARKEGHAIGSWDHFTKPEVEEDDDAGIGWKGGSAAVDDISDPGFPASEAARIRRKVTTGTDRDLSEKEVWFVATGAEEVGTVGMKAFLKEHGPDVRDAFIINIDNVGTGSVTYVDSEGMAKRYRSDRRIMGAARRAVTENGLTIRSRDYKGLSTDATPALARGFRAMSVMAFDINGRLPNWHWATDTVENVDEKNLETAAEFVCALIKEL